MLAAENGALEGGKVGGVGDVIRDVPVALADRGWKPTVLTPAYGFLADRPGARAHGTIDVAFGGARRSVDVYDVPGPDARVRHQVLDHPLFAPHGPGHIYWDDSTQGPYYCDASKFAFFCAAAAAFVVESDVRPDIMHLHDWHTGLLFALRRFDERFRALRKIRTVFSIHNLAYQGTRPLKETDSSLHAWFPRLRYAAQVVADPRHPACVNPMATAIRLADQVHAVSPSYAREILKPASGNSGANGGEGLEAELRAAASQDRLVGILNGCWYPDAPARRPRWQEMLESMREQLPLWVAREPDVASVHYLAERRLARLPVERPSVVLTSVGRIVSQKVSLFREAAGDGRSALEHILDRIGSEGLLIILGSGDPGYERFFAEVAARHTNFLLLRGYSDPLAHMLYAAGDLFLMPSSFEPCGISQMLAMRAGQPCVVHAVGGLKDTVDDECGFVFHGASPRLQAERFIESVAHALETKRSDPPAWNRIREAAARRRFTWEASVEAYERALYDEPSCRMPLLRDNARG